MHGSLEDRAFELADLVSEDPYITPEQAMKQMKLEESAFWEVVDTLRQYIESGQPLPPRRTKTTWRDILAYG